MRLWRRSPARYIRNTSAAAGNLVADWQIRHMDAFAASTLVNFQGASPLQLRRLAHGHDGRRNDALGADIRITRAIWTSSANRRRNFGWGVEAREFDADDYVIGQTWLELFELDRRP